MKQFLTVLRFELNNYFKNKSFLLTTIILIVLAVGIIALPGIITAVEGGSSASEESTVETEESSGESSEETVALLDENGSIADPEAFSAAMGMNIKWMECTDKDQVEDAVNDGTAEAGFIVEDLLHYTYVVENRSMSDTMQEAFSAAAAAAYRAQVLSEQGIDPAEIETLYQTPAGV